MSDTKNDELGAVAPDGEGEVPAPLTAPASTPRSAVPRERSTRSAPSDSTPLAGEGEEDDETWTNHPGSGAKAADGNLDEELDGDEDELDDDEEEGQAPVARKQIQNGRDVLVEELPLRAQRAKLRIRPHLVGALVIELSNSGERFLFDWRGEDAKVSPFKGDIIVAADSTDPARVEAHIAISEQNLMAVRSGDLNPQVAMLAEKIKVKGKMGPAVYLFNLIAPRVRD
jgi:putative sterol carrier protein